MLMAPLMPAVIRPLQADHRLGAQRKQVDQIPRLEVRQEIVGIVVVRGNRPWIRGEKLPVDATAAVPMPARPPAARPFRLALTYRDRLTGDRQGARAGH